MVLDAAKRFLGSLALTGTAYSGIKKGRRKRWYEEIREQRARDIETGMI
jgi:hypothetical protein